MGRRPDSGYKGELTISALKERLSYSPETGEWVWLVRENGMMEIGQRAGDNSKKYTFIKVFRKKYAAHRLAWFYMTGEWPEYIDHIDGDKKNNKWSNLRKATKSQNNSNVNKRIDNKSGFKGVIKTKTGNFRAYISKEGQRYNLGTYKRKENAALAYNFAAIELHGEFANLNLGT